MSLAVRVSAVDAALIAKYSGISINTGEPPVPTGVTPFIEEPSTEETPERVYPSVVLKLIAINPRFELSESTDDEKEEVDYDDTVFPHERVMRDSPLPYTLMYSLDTWHKIRVGESRDLVYEAIIKRTNPRGYLTVTNIDGNPVTPDLFWGGGVVENDEKKPDIVIYHKTLTLEIPVWLILDDTETREKVAMYVEWKVSSYETKTELDGSIVPIAGSETLDVDFYVDGDDNVTRK